MTIIEESPTKAKQIATATFVLVFSVLLLGGGLPDHRQYQILSSSGRNLTSIFQDLRPSRQASPRRLLTAKVCLSWGAVQGRDSISAQREVPNCFYAARTRRTLCAGPGTKLRRQLRDM